jgi:predicted DsbA family dithiol-disulfide isomerase
VRIEQLRKNYEIEVRWTAFPLHPETPEEGLALEELFAGRDIDIEKAVSRLKQVAEELGLPLGKRKKTYNSRLAQELAKWAESNGRGDPFNEAVFRAYFVDGKNIGKADVLAALAKSIGLLEEGARSVLELRTFKRAVDSDWSRSHQLGITAVPTFLINDRMLVGFPAYERLEEFTRASGAEKRKSPPPLPAGGEPVRRQPGGWGKGR